MKSKLRPELSVQERQQLVDAGLLELERRGRAVHVRATDAAWDWASSHLDARLSKSASAAPVLKNLLSILQRFLQREQRALADLLLVADTQPEPASAAVAATAAALPAAPVARRIRDAIVDIAGGTARRRVRLSELRERLRDVPREQLDEELLELQAGQHVVLYRLDNPAELTPADQQAALFVAGNPRHLVYLEA